MAKILIETIKATPSISQAEFTAQVALSEKLQKFSYDNIRLLLLTEALAALDNDSRKPYQEVVAIAHGLKEFGFELEGIKVLEAVQADIQELNPSLLSWIKDQTEEYNRELSFVCRKLNKLTQKRRNALRVCKGTKFFVESAVVEQYGIEVTFCFWEQKNDEKKTWFDTLIPADVMFKIAHELLKDAIKDSCDHTGEHQQRIIPHITFDHIQDYARMHTEKVAEYYLNTNTLFNIL